MYSQLGAAGALAALLAHTLPAAAQQEVQAAVKADIRVAPARPGEKLVPGAFARVTIAYRDAVTGLAPRGLAPAAWIRRLDAGRPACERAAQNFRVTRALTRDDVPLIGAWIAIRNTDATISIIDPKIDFQGSGMVSIKPMGETPAAFVELARNQQLAVSLPVKGAVVGYNLPDLGEAWRSTPLARPGALAASADGALFVAENSAGGIAKLAAGKIAGRWPVGPGPISLISVPESPRFAASLVAIAADGAAIWIEAASARQVAILPPGSFAAGRALAAWPGGLASIDAHGRLGLRYRDSATTVRDVATPLVIEDMSVDGSGRYLLAWSNSALQAELIDLAFGRPVQGFALAGPISNAVFSGDTLFAGHAGIAAISIIDLAPLRSGAEALVRPARLEPGDANAKDSARKIIVRAIGDSDNVVALREGDSTLFVLHGGAGHASPIVGTITLRGGRPADIGVLDRGLQEIAPGVFEARATLPLRGPLEVVATTGVGGVTACSRVALGEADDANTLSEPRLTLAAEPRLRAGQPALVKLRLDGVLSPPQTVQFLAVALAGSAWRATVAAVLAPDGTYTLPLTFPAAGDYPLIPIGPGLGDRIAPLIMEVRS